MFIVICAHISKDTIEGVGAPKRYCITFCGAWNPMFMVVSNCRDIHIPIVQVI
jgi:hypothetical protein